MQPKFPLPGSPEDWMRHAESDLELARIPLPPKVLLEELCFHAQQAAEKALKAVLIANKTVFPKTHNLRTLLDLLPSDIIPPPDVEDAALLTDYAISIRYPGIFESIDPEDYQKALGAAGAMIVWAKKVLRF